MVHADTKWLQSRINIFYLKNCQTWPCWEVLQKPPKWQIGRDPFCCCPPKMGSLTRHFQVAHQERESWLKFKFTEKKEWYRSNLAKCSMEAKEAKRWVFKMIIRTWTELFLWLPWSILVGVDCESSVTNPMAPVGWWFLVVASLVGAFFLAINLGIFPEIMGIAHHPNWRSHIFSEGYTGPPTRWCYQTRLLIFEAYHVIQLGIQLWKPMGFSKRFTSKGPWWGFHRGNMEWRYNNDLNGSINYKPTIREKLYVNYI